MIMGDKERESSFLSISSIKEMVMEDSHEPSIGRYRIPLPNRKINPFLLFFLKKGVPADQLYRLGIFVCDKSPESHIGPFVNAIDFLVPSGTPILAADSGKIVSIKEDSQIWGEDESFSVYLNYIDLLHDNGEFSEYCHIKAGSVSKLGLKIGDRVKRGQVIAKLGRNGWMDRDHLHFLVFKITEEKPGFKSLAIVFEDDL